jgi:sugar lactone lactonase YvrE
MMIPSEEIEIFATLPEGPEGLAFDRAGFLYSGPANGWVYRVTPDGRVDVFAQPGGRVTGVSVDPWGRDLFVCNFALGLVQRISRDGNVSNFAESIGGRSLGRPNFCAFDARGDLLVTNSGEAIFRVTRDGKVAVFADGFQFSNGLAVAPDGRHVFVVESDAERVTRIEIGADGTAGGRVTYAEGLRHRPDGLALDLEGNLYVTLVRSDKIVVVDLRGNVRTLLEDRSGRVRGPSNCAFGGDGFDELYFANLWGNHIGRVRVGIPGVRLLRPLVDRSGSADESILGLPEVG